MHGRDEDFDKYRYSNGLTRNSTSGTDRNLSLCRKSLGLMHRCNYFCRRSLQSKQPYFHMPYSLVSTTRCLCPRSRNFPDRAIQIHSRLLNPYELSDNLPGKFLQYFFETVKRNWTHLKSQLRSSRYAFLQLTEQGSLGVTFRTYPVRIYTALPVSLRYVTSCLFCGLARPPNRPQSSRF